jgi:Transposase DDE domain
MNNNIIIYSKDEEYKCFILQTVNELCPSKKQRKYSNEYYLQNILYLLNDICKWSSLQILYPNKAKYHYKTIQDKFKEWSDKNIFEIAYYKLINKHIFSNFNKNTTLNLLIDSSDINNVNGSELAVYGQNKKKKQTKVSFICDRNKIIYGITLYEASEHDTQTIITSINNIKDRFKYRKINITGDKGYISQKIKNDLKLYNIKLMYPHKKNMKKRTPLTSKKHLKYRYKVEHAIRDNKCNDRIKNRKDRLISTYKSFIYLSMSINLQKFITKMKNPT